MHQHLHRSYILLPVVDYYNRLNTETKERICIIQNIKVSKNFAIFQEQSRKFLIAHRV
jgi:hypothetical protein